MTAARTFSALFNSDGTPRGGRPHTSPMGASADEITHTFATTELDEDGDRVALIPVPEYRRLVYLAWDCADLDTHLTPTIDGDLVLRTKDGGTVTTTILFNGGTSFQAAEKDWVILNNVVPQSGDAAPAIEFLTNTKAATPAAVAIKVYAVWI